MAVPGKVDKLVKKFLQGSSNPHTPFDPFDDLQDPTYLSFRVDFYIDVPEVIQPVDAYSTSGLFNPPLSQNPLYGIRDSAEDYLQQIGSPKRLAYLRSFKQLLSKVDRSAPWYFQSVSGLADLYTFDPAINERAKEKELTFTCLESIDLRMSLLADLYRNMAFDLEYHREILPRNLRTFNMDVHVLEFRKFNTTFGRIADAVSGRKVSGANNQQNSLNNSTPDDSVLSQDPGLFGGQGSGGNTGIPSATLESLKSEFEAVSVMTFRLRSCEFDFYSVAPSYLDNVSVVDSPQADFQFKVKVGKVEKLTTYSFYDYIIAEFQKDSKMNLAGSSTSPLGSVNSEGLPDNYLENTPFSSSDTAAQIKLNREGIYPTDGEGNSTKDQYKNYNLSKSDMRRRNDNNPKKEYPRRGVVGSALENVAGRYINDGIGKLNSAVRNLSGGLITTDSLGNVYGKAIGVQRVVDSLNSFLGADLQLATGVAGSQTTQLTSKNVGLNGAKPNQELSSSNVNLTGTTPSQTISNQGDLTGTIPSESISQSSLENAPVLPGLSSPSVGFIAPSTPTITNESGFDNAPTPSQISQSSMEDAPSAGTISEGGMEDAPSNRPISSSSMEDAPSTGTISEGGMEDAPSTGTISEGSLDSAPTPGKITQSGFENAPSNGSITGGGLDPAPSPGTISEGGMESAPSNTQITQNGGFESSITTPSSIPSGGFENPPSLPGISENGGMEDAPSSGTISEGSMEDAPSVTEISQGGFDPAPSPGTISEGGMESAPSTGNISQGGFDAPPSPGNITEGGFSSTPLSGEISKSGFDPAPTQPGISEGGFDPAPAQPGISEGGMEDAPSSSEISQGGFDPAPSSNNISESPLGNAPKKGTISQGGFDPAPSNSGTINPSGFDPAPSSGTISDGGMEDPPSSPDISGDNVYDE